MESLTGSQIRDRALAYLEKEPAGIRYAQLARMVHDSAPDTPMNTVHGSLHKFLASTGDIVRPSRGLWQLKKYADVITEPAAAIKEAVLVEKTTKLYEVHFYE